MDDEREIVTPRHGLVTRGEHPGAQVARVPPLALLAWGEKVYASALAKLARPREAGFAAERSVVVGEFAGREVALVHPGLGAPATALVAEKLVAAGARIVVGAGFAGIIAPGLAPGRAMVVDASARDEGTSGHYGAKDEFERASPRVVGALMSALPEARRGASWTTDAAYRETVSAMRRFRALGCSLVEMESAALFAVARFRAFEAGAVLVAADDLSSATWTPAPPGSLDGAAARVAKGALDALSLLALP